MKIFRKVIPFFVVALFLLPSQSHAQTLAPASPTNWDMDKNIKKTVERLPDAAICSLIQVHGCVGTGKDGSTKIVYDPQGKFVTSGALISVSQLASAVFDTPPTSTTLYLADIGKDLGLVDKSYAQVRGSGAGIIEPVKKLWEVTRNMAYMGFMLVFIFVGFMIMLRQKINPQTVVSVQAALPGLVVGLILVTISYFIAALMVDLAFWGIQFVAQVFEAAKPNIYNPAELAKDSNLFNLFNKARETVSLEDIHNSVDKLQGSAFGSIGYSIPVIIGALAGILAGPLGILTGALAGAFASELVSGLVSLILIIALFVQLFRLFFALVGTYIQILVYTVTGPFLILASSIPGRGGGISNWIKAIAANALVFPAVFAAFMFGGLILASASDWTASPPLFGNISTEILKAIIAYGIILGTPAIPDMVRNALGVKPLAGGLDKAAMGGFMGGVAVGRAGWNRVTSPLRAEADAYHKAEAARRGVRGSIFEPFYGFFPRH